MSSGILGFLFDGKPPPSVTTYGTTSNNVPQWFSDYTQGILNQANAVAGQPYQSYEGPRIAGFSPEQEQAFALAEGNVGSYKPALGEAMDMTKGVLGQVAPTIGTNLATAGGTFTGDNVSRYMNPYIENVTKRSQELANRNFNETLLPQIKNMFTRAGQYGSTRMADTVGKAARDTSESLQSAADASLAQGFTTAGQMFGADASRAGTLAQLGVQSTLQGSKDLSALGETLSRLGLSDAATLEGIGQQRRGLTQQSLDLAKSDFDAQRDYPKTQTDWLSNIIRGIPNNAVPSSTTRSETGPYQGDMQQGLVGSLGSLLSLWKAINTDNSSKKEP